MTIGGIRVIALETKVEGSTVLLPRIYHTETVDQRSGGTRRSFWFARHAGPADRYEESWS